MADFLDTIGSLGDTYLKLRYPPKPPQLPPPVNAPVQTPALVPAVGDRVVTGAPVVSTPGPAAGVYASAGSMLSNPVVLIGGVLALGLLVVLLARR